MEFDRYRLENGLRLIGMPQPYFRSASVGIWVGSGSQYELSEEAGLSHLAEHMAFKGTTNRTTRDIAVEMDAVGGQLDAFTTRECTCYSATVINEALPTAMDVLCDMFTQPAYRAEELERETKVVCEEIAMAGDDPEDLVNELLIGAMYPNSGISRPILGTEEALNRYTSADLFAFKEKRYSPENTVLAISGNYDWDHVREMAERFVGNWKNAAYSDRIPEQLMFHAGAAAREKDLEQTHICIGYEGLPIGHRSGYELALLNTVFGGAMSSRLFQRIREESGSAYTVYSADTSFVGGGMWYVYAAVGTENADRVFDMIREETDRFARYGMTDDEFRTAKRQLRAEYILGLESPEDCMEAIGRRLLLLNETRTEEEALRRMEALRKEDCEALAMKLLQGTPATAVVGSDAEDILRRNTVHS